MRLNKPFPSRVAFGHCHGCFPWQWTPNQSSPCLLSCLWQSLLVDFLLCMPDLLMWGFSRFYLPSTSVQEWWHCRHPYYAFSFTCVLGSPTQLFTLVWQALSPIKPSPHPDMCSSLTAPALLSRVYPHPLIIAIPSIVNPRPNGVV